MQSAPWFTVCDKKITSILFFLFELLSMLLNIIEALSSVTLRHVRGPTSRNHVALASGATASSLLPI